MGAKTGSVSRNMYDENKRYVQREVVQGVPWVDADDNDLEQGNYNMNRRIQQLLGTGAVENGFKCVGTGAVNDFTIMGGGGTGETAGRFFLDGHGCLLFGDTTWKNGGSNEDGKSVHSRITDVVYNSGPGTSLLTDSAENWGVDEHAGKTITPDITQPGSTFTIVSNTQTQLLITGDVTTVAAIGDNYRIELRAPIGSDRVDGVFLNVYLDEYDCTDDPNLIHHLTTSVCAQLRIKLIQEVYIKEGSESFPAYVDSDGNEHWTFQIARLRRYDSQNEIYAADLEDLRPIIYDGLGSLEDVWARVNNLKPVVSDPAANTIDILPGVWTHSDRLAIGDLATRTTSSTFAAVSGSGQVRYDLVSIDDAGALQIKAGTEIPAPGDPFTNGPSPDGDKLALAYIRITEPSGVVITRDDITDVREFLNIGMAASALTGYAAALWLRPHAQSTPTNTVRVEAGRYVKSDRTGFIDKPTAFSSGVFSPVLIGTNVRYDLLQMDDAGVPQIKAGVEVVAPGNPFTDAPAPDNDKLTIAIVRITETGAVILTDADITDMREFLNLGGAGGPGTVQKYVHPQVVGSSSWAVGHGLGTTDVAVQVYNGSSQLIIPDSVTIVDSNNVTVAFTANQTGKAIVLG